LNAPLINFRGVFCYKNHAQASNEKAANFYNIVFLIVFFINQKRLTLREPLLLLVEKMELEQKSLKKGSGASYS